MRWPHPLSCSVRVKKLAEDAQVPKQQTEGSSGFDLHAYSGSVRGYDR